MAELNSGAVGGDFKIDSVSMMGEGPSWKVILECTVTSGALRGRQVELRFSEEEALYIHDKFESAIGMKTK